MPEDRRIFTDLTVCENLEVGRRAPREAAPPWEPERLFALFPNLAAMPAGAPAMSGGEQQMLTIARTLMGNPELVLLDEPSEGLAPVIVEQMAEAVMRMKEEGIAVLLSRAEPAFRLGRLRPRRRHREGRGALRRHDGRAGGRRRRAASPSERVRPWHRRGASPASTSAAPSPTCCSIETDADGTRVQARQGADHAPQPGRSASWPRSPRPASRPADLDLVIHGTTTTTNAMLERKIAKVGLITTRGFRDMLELGRRTRPKPYGLFGTFEPLIPRELRLEVDERMDAEGEVVTAARRGGSRRGGARRCWPTGCESLVIHFLHAYANPAHELRAGEIVASALAERLRHARPSRCCRSSASTSAARPRR